MTLKEPGSVRDVVKSRALLSDRRFFSLWLCQGIAQTASNAMLFALLVVVLRITGSSVHTSILILSFTLPSIPLGVFVGVVLDRVNKGHVLVVTNALRAATSVLFFFFHSDEWVIYAVSLAFSTAGLFFSPAVVSMIPSLVSRERLVSANSLYNFTFTAAQLLGIVFVAPTFLKSLHEEGMFLAAAAMFVGASILGYPLRGVPVERQARTEAVTVMPSIGREFRESLRTILADKYSTLALGQLIVSSTLVLIFAILIPRYMQEVLGVPPDNAAFVFAPTGIGALIGLRFLPVFTRRGKNRAVAIGLSGIAVSLALLAVVEPIAEVTELAPGSAYLERLLRVSLLQALTMCFAGPMGFFYAMLNAPAQTVLHERAPPEMRGRIFATQVLSASTISLVPLFMIGAVTDLLGVTIVLLLIAVTVLSFAALSVRIGGDEAGGEKPPSEGRREAAAARAQIDTPQGVR